MLAVSECISVHRDFDVAAKVDTECPNFCPIALIIETDARITLQLDECHAQSIYDAIGGALAKLRGQRANVAAPIAAREAYVAAELPTS